MKESEQLVALFSQGGDSEGGKPRECGGFPHRFAM